MAHGCALERRLPVTSIAVENFIRHRQLEAHHRRVLRPRTFIDNAWTKEEVRVLQKPRRNVKREQMKEDRFADIERENARLLGRMQEIEHRGPARAAGKQVLSGAVLPSCARSRSVPCPRAGSNSGARNREQRRIEQDNLRLLKRLQGAKPSISQQQLEGEHRALQKVMRMRCEHHQAAVEAAERHPHQPKGFRSHSAGGLLRPQSAAVAAAATATATATDQASTDFERLQQLQDDLRLQLEADEAAAGESSTDLESQLPNDKPSSPCGSEGAVEDPTGAGSEPSSPFGGRIPAMSRARSEAILATFSTEPCRQGFDAEEGLDAEEAAISAKEAADEALRKAQAMDAGSQYLCYDDVVQRPCMNSAY